MSKRTTGFILITALLITLSILFYRVVWHDIPTLVNALDHCDQLFCDFVRQYYRTGQQLFESGEPTDGYFYTSFFAIFLAGFGQFEQPIAMLLWSIFQLGSLALMFLPGFYFFNRRPLFGILYIALLLLSMPVLHNLKWGQVSTTITGAIFATTYLNRRGHARAGAVVLGLAASVKYYAILFALYNFLSKQWRFILILFFSIFLFVIIVPLLFLGWDLNLAFYQRVSEQIAHARVDLIPKDGNSQYLGHVVARLAADKWQITADPLLWRLIGFGLSGIGILCSIWIVRHDWEEADHWLLAINFLILPFFTETSWPHYFVYIPFILVFLLWKLWQKSWPWRAGGGVVLLISAVFASMPYFGWLNDRRSYASVGTLFWVDLALFLLLLAMVLPIIWQQFRQEEAHRFI